MWYENTSLRICFGWVGEWCGELGKKVWGVGEWVGVGCGLLWGAGCGLSEVDGTLPYCLLSLYFIFFSHNSFDRNFFDRNSVISLPLPVMSSSCASCHLLTLSTFRLIDHAPDKATYNSIAFLVVSHISGVFKID